MTEFRNLSLPGCLEIRPNVFDDERGCFVKTFHRDVFESEGLNTTWNEEYYSKSYRDVIRGLHFQVPPHDHVKMVYCLQGRVLDVIVDLRQGSPSCGRFETIELSSESGNIVYIPSGIAHGFCVLTEHATMQYKVSTVYSAEHDCGIRWDSIGFRWPIVTPIISARDKGFPGLDAFKSPFRFGHD
ncbi:dTDP-4-dehydrorhamnose 3,5-epimerase [Pandoraea sp.]|uniref:dTDP-4-dehydrorhamnose 3,5-epimerase n=1 Tax=Pandoraea sp. TaxID=1883445 RepID=UPI00120403DE|nr:MAG: dTDP-4-dehydrorhamnose 3,5-epimerase [Pandoraea sp.]